MKKQHMKLPIIIIMIGMIVAIASCFPTGILKEPMIKEHDFEYSVTYKLDGDIKTAVGVFKCSFTGYDGYDDPTVRNYVGEYTRNGIDLNSHSFTIAQKDGVELSIITLLDAAYLMGDPDKYEHESGNEDPYLEAVDSEGYGVEVSEVFDCEIIGWEYPNPVENSFRFVGFSALHAGSMLAMLLVGVLTIIACIIFVKKDNGITYKALDKLSVVLNFIIGFAGIPFLTLVIGMFQLTFHTEGLIYQVYLCVPAMTAFTVAASVVLRRKGFTRFGFIVQLICPMLFMGTIYLESLICNLFF